MLHLLVRRTRPLSTLETCLGSGLSFLALGFDTLFLVQHFVLYHGAEEEDESQQATRGGSERDRLLPPGATV